jgi:hypothetical protein
MVRNEKFNMTTCTYTNVFLGARGGRIKRIHGFEIDMSVIVPNQLMNEWHLRITQNCPSLMAGA